LYHFSRPESDSPAAALVSGFAELTELGAVLVPDAPEATEAAVATELASEATEPVDEPVVEAPSEALEELEELEDATLGIWS
jgi:hypothetical protein